MNDPKCPKCPCNLDGHVAPSSVKPGEWFCNMCGSYFPKIAGVSPPDPTLKNLVVLETDPDLRWSAEEVESASDKPLAQFYAGLNSEDRRDLLCNHILVNGDFR
jgi:hypothetical protein